MSINWKTTKLVTEVVTPWLTFVGLLAGGLYTLYEYGERQKEARVATTMQYVSRYMTPPLSDHRAALFNAWEANEDTILPVLMNKQLTTEEIVKQFQTTMLNVVREASLGLSIQEELLYFEQLTQCIDIELCDRAVAQSTLHIVARDIFDQYYPYICSLRDRYGDPSIGAALERFARAGKSAKFVCPASLRADAIPTKNLEVK